MAKHILITGASSGIGRATAQAVAGPDVALSLGARRTERLEGVAEGAFTHSLDVTDEASVEAFLTASIAANGPIDVLVNNAGLARDIELVSNANGKAWREMMETNVMGVMHITRRVLPAMLERGAGDIVMIGSIAGHESYEGGSAYCASKSALMAFTKGLRYETYNQGVRVMSVDPGLVETEFSEVRFRGDLEKAAQVYAGTRALQADDVAACVAFALSRPAHVNLDTILVMPTDQASPKRVHRRD